MPTLEDVYFEFGLASEAAQLLETELGTILFRIGAIEADLFENPDHDKAYEILQFVNRQTVGQLMRSVNKKNESLEGLEDILTRALKERNRLAHSFYREHNNRRNSEDGRAIMLRDLEYIHDAILDANKAVMRFSGIDLDSMSIDKLPTEHLPIL